MLSHLGSGAEIGLLGLERTLVNGTLLDREDFAVIWERWDNLGALDKTSEMVAWDRRYVSVLQALDDETLKSLRMNLFGMDLDAAGLVGIRLGEHALHSWDVAVTFDPEGRSTPFFSGTGGRPYSFLGRMAGQARSGHLQNPDQDPDLEP